MKTAVIVDDMPNAIRGLQKDIEEYCQNIKIIGTADGVIDAAKKMKELSPDILFLDIQLGDGTGFDLLEILPNTDFKIIFTTASDEHALKAFRYAAVDYLLKPIDIDALIEAVDRACAMSSTKNNDSIELLKEVIADEQTTLSKIALHTQEQIKIVELKDIVNCVSDNNNTIFYFNNGSNLFVTKTLKYFENLLESANFIRVHQSHLVNIDYIEAYIKTEGGYLLLKNDKNVPVSVRKKSMVIDLLDNI